MIALKHLHVSYNKVPVLKDINIGVGEREIVAVIGANGAGKTTLMKVISGQKECDRGEIFWHDYEISKLDTQKRVKLGIIHVPEGRKLFPKFTVNDNLVMGSFVRNRKGKEVNADLEFVFKLFPVLRDRRKQKAASLSGGEQQMVAIGRGLMAGPKLLILDEPSLGLAPIVIEHILEILKSINSQGTTILIVEQNVLMALNLANRGYLIELGEIVLGQSAESLRNNEIIRKSYLGIV